jgi:RNA polymerase sigma factor (sigma-70 family)
MNRQCSALEALEPHNGEGGVYKRSNPGLLLFNLSRQLLQINTEGLELCAALNQSRLLIKATGVIPHEVFKVIDAVTQVLRNDHDAKIWDQFDYRWVVGESTYPMLVRGLAIPDTTSLLNTRILVMMERVGTRQAANVQQVFQEYQLTDREQNVLQQLLKGLTNKEIANNLGISEQTVKDHFKRLMHKMKVSTRTALLSRLVQFGDHGASHLRAVGAIQ